MTSCALHYGQNVDCGHYTSVTFDGNNVVEINDLVVKDITFCWQNYLASTIYLAFYSIVEEEPNDNNSDDDNDDDDDNYDYDDDDNYNNDDDDDDSNKEDNEPNYRDVKERKDEQHDCKNNNFTTGSEDNIPNACG